MAASRAQRANPSLLPDATYLALRRMIEATAAKETGGAVTEPGEAPSFPPVALSHGDLACRCEVGVTNRLDECHIENRLGWVRPT
jgi:hypothetical protein